METALGIAECLSGLADLALAAAPERAARLLAVAGAIRQALDAPTSPVEGEAEARRVAAARAALGEAAFEMLGASVQASAEDEPVAMVEALSR